LLPGGLPKTQLYEGLAETVGAGVLLLRQESNQICYSFRGVGIHLFYCLRSGNIFFQANEEYAHGGISVQECLLPVLISKIQLNQVWHLDHKCQMGRLKCAVDTENAGKDYTLIYEPNSMMKPHHCDLKEQGCN
jgi:hypothetical protein